MKLKFTSLLFALSFLMFALMSNSGGRAASAGQGSTGAPGDGSDQCSTCHQGGDFGAALEIEITDTDGTVITEYEPGVVYNVAATVTTTTAPSGYGLQLVSLLDGDNTDTNGLASPSANAQISPLDGRNYLEQAGLSGSETFTAEWTAPAEGSGSVSFYAAGHAANGNGQSSGDQAVNTSISITEKIVNKTANTKINTITVYPNPVVDFVNLNWDDNSYMNIEVMNLQGEAIYSTASKNSSLKYDASQLKSGVYLFRMTDLSTFEVVTKKFVKL